MRFNERVKKDMKGCPPACNTHNPATHMIMVAVSTKNLGFNGRPVLGLCLCSLATPTGWQGIRGDREE